MFNNSDKTEIYHKKNRKRLSSAWSKW